MSHQMILKRWLISGLGKEMHKIILGIVKNQTAEGLQNQRGLDRNFRNPDEKAKHLPVCWAE